MSDVIADTAPASAGDLNEADAASAFATMAAKRFDDEDNEKVVEDPAAKPTPVAPAADDKPAAAAPAAAATDIWASAPAELKAAHEAEISRWDQKYKSDVGRQAAHQRRIADLEEQLRAKTATPAATDSTASAPASLRDRPAIKKGLEEYPEVMEPLVETLEPILADNANLRRELGHLTDHRRQEVLSAQEDALQTAHPDWKAACASPEFAEWLETRPESIKAIVRRNGEHVVDAAEAITIVGDFKAHHALTHPKNAAPADPVVVPPTDLEARRARQLQAVIAAPLKPPAGIPDGAPGGGEKAVFDHFASKKAQRK